jgi:hypothetical protein
LPALPPQDNINALATSAIATAGSEAKKFAGLNRAGDKSSLMLLDGDIVVGTLPPSGPVTAWAPGGAFPNSVQVTLYRNASANGPLPLLFGSILGTSTWSGSATATAVYQGNASSVTGFNPPANGANPLLLPIGIDINYWNQFIQTGQSTDGQVYDNYTVRPVGSALTPPNNIINTGDYIPELQGVYPDSTSPGNFGLIDIGPNANDTPTFSRWILNGPSPSDMTHFGTTGLQATPGSPATLKGGPGWKSELQDQLAAIIGQPRIVPLFSSYTGTGQNSTYTIIGFAGVTVVQATGRGSNETIVFQPTMVVDRTATTGPGASSSYYIYSGSPLQLRR